MVATDATLAPVVATEAGLEAGVSGVLTTAIGVPAGAAPGAASRLTSEFDGPDPSMRFATLAACFEASAAAADALAASLEATAAFSEAARACLALFLLPRPLVSSATGAALGVGVAAMVGVGVGVGAGELDDPPLKKFVTGDAPDVPPAHPARKIRNNQSAPGTRRRAGRSIRLCRARDRWFGGRIGSNRNRNLAHRTLAEFGIYYYLTAIEFDRPHRERQA